MSIIEAFKLALQSLWGNKMRSILTLIGVVMGVASVIMVITLVNGANRYVSTKLSGYGADVFTVARMPSVIFTAEEYLNYQKRKIIRIEDYKAVKDACAECSEVGALLTKSTNAAANGHSSNNTRLGGGDPIGKEIRVDGIPYTIIGVAERQGNTLGQSQDNWVAIPITTYQ